MTNNHHHQGIAFLEYVDPSATDVAIEALNGMPLGTDLRLKAKKASIGITQVAGEINVNAMSMLAGTTSIDPDVSRVLQLLNMVTPDELMDNDDYEGMSYSFSTCFEDQMKLTYLTQKFATISKRSARSLARSSR